MGQDLRAETDLAIICWRGPNAELTTGCPMPGRYAEALAAAFQSLDPARKYWVEAVPWLGPSPRRAGRHDV